MESEQFFLKWNNFENNLTTGFADLLEQEAMVDVTLAAEGKIVQAHKIILSICSSYFRNMFQANPCQHPIVVLKDVGYQELTDMLDFMYKGEANVRQQDLPSFLKLAETLKVKGLAGNQAEPDHSSNKRNSIVNFTKESSSNDKEVPSNDYMTKDTILRKRGKRSVSPLLSPDSKGPQAQSIKLELEEFDGNNLGSCVTNTGPNVITKEERFSDNSLDSYDNHIAQETLAIDKNPGPSTLDENFEAVPQDATVTTEYEFSDTSHGGRFLIFRGYCFRKKNSTGTSSYWFCCKVKCPARGILRSNGRFQLTESSHNHDPDTDRIKKQESLKRIKKLALLLDTPGRELLTSLGVDENIKKYLSFIRACRSRSRKRNQNLSNPSIQGYEFRQDSVYRNKQKCEYWRCKIKGCRARAKTDETGNLTLLNTDHTHSPQGTTAGQTVQTADNETLASMTSTVLPNKKTKW